MNTYTLLILTGLAAVIVAVWYAVTIRKSRLLDKREAAVEEKTAWLKVAQDRLVADQKTLEQRYREIAPWMRSASTDLKVSYTVTESDELRFSSDQAIANVARNRLAHLLANDIIRNFPQPAVDEVDGRTRYSYRFVVREEKYNG